MGSLKPSTCHRIAPLTSRLRRVMTPVARTIRSAAAKLYFTRTRVRSQAMPAVSGSSLMVRLAVADAPRVTPFAPPADSMLPDTSRTYCGSIDAQPAPVWYSTT
jgi:hypothetical protein